MRRLHYRKYLLGAMITSLITGALLGIWVFAIGNYHETALRLLWSSLATSAFSLAGLCCLTIFYRDNLRTLSIMGILISVLALVATILIIWDIVPYERLWKVMVILVVLAVTAGHISLLFLIKPKTKKIKLFLNITLAVILLVALMIIILTIKEFEQAESYYRLLAVFVILMVLGTTATPILNLMSKKKQP